MGTTEQAAALLTGIRKEKRRYVRDQFKLMQRIVAEQPQEAIDKAIVYCLERIALQCGRLPGRGPVVQSAAIR